MSTIESLKDFCKDKGGTSLRNETYYVCANFLFYTSMYEEKLFNSDKQHSVDNDRKVCEELINNNIVDLSEFDYFGEFLCSRYLNCDTTNKYFNNLRLKGRNKGMIEKSLLDFEKDKKRDVDLLFAYIQITYRFRNNMFHGSKGLINLNSYSEQFKELNRFLRHLLSEIVDKKYTGFNS